MSKMIKKLNKIAIVGVNTYWEFKEMCQTLLIYTNVSLDGSKEIFDNCSSAFGKNELVVLFNICECASSEQDIKNIVSIVATHEVSDNKKLLPLQDFKVMHEHKDMRTLLKIKALKWNESERKNKELEDFRINNLPELLEKQQQTRNEEINEILRFFNAMEVSSQINVEIKKYNDELYKLLENDYHHNACLATMKRISNNDVYKYVVGLNEIENDESVTIAEFNVHFHLDYTYAQRNGSVIYEGGSTFSDMALFSNTQIVSSSNIKQVTDKMDGMINKATTMGCNWIYPMGASSHDFDEDEIFISFDEVKSKIERQLYNLKKVIPSFYERYNLALTIIDAEIQYHRIKRN